MDLLEIRNVFLGGTKKLPRIALQQTVDLVLSRGAIRIAIAEPGALQVTREGEREFVFLLIVIKR